MVDHLITKYLASGKRLVVPELGTFIRKDTGNEIVFVEFLKRDDGILNGLLREHLHSDEEEARAVIQKFVHDLRKQITMHGYYTIDGLGILIKDKSGIYELSYNPGARSNRVIQVEDTETSTPAQSAASQATLTQQEPPAAPVTGYDPHKQSTVSYEPYVAAEQTVRAEATNPDSLSAPERTREQHAASSSSTSPATDQRNRWQTILDPATPQGAQNRPQQTHGPSEPRLPQPAQEHPHQTTVQTPRRQNPPRQARPVARKPKKKGMDLVMIIAIVAAIVALGSIIFGVMTPADPVKMLYPTNQSTTEQVIDQDENAQSDQQTTE